MSPWYFWNNVSELNDLSADALGLCRALVTANADNLGGRKMSQFLIEASVPTAESRSPSGVMSERMSYRDYSENFDDVEGGAGNGGSNTKVLLRRFSKADAASRRASIMMEAHSRR